MPVTVLQLQRRDSASDLAGLLRELALAAGESDRRGDLPQGVIETVQRSGLAALTVPARLGGGGADFATALATIRQVGGACASTGLILAMQWIQHAVIARSPVWPVPLAERLGRDAVRNGALVNALRVEPALGTPSRGGLPETTARRVPEGWSISGRKIYSTGAPHLAWMLVWARDDAAEPRVGTFLVPGGSPGIRIEHTWDQLGLRASASHDVVFEDVIVPADHAVDLRPAAEARPADLHQIAWNTLAIGALYTGVAEAALEWSLRFLRERVPANLGSALATLPRVQEAVGRIEGRLAANRRILESAARATDLGDPPAAEESGVLKVVLAENAVSAVEEAVRLSGNHALARANPLERHLRDVLCARIHAPQEDAAHLAAGRRALLAGTGALR